MAAGRIARLRSQRWFGAEDVRAFGHRSRTLRRGLAHKDFMGKPLVAIVNIDRGSSPL